MNGSLNNKEHRGFVVAGLGKMGMNHAALLGAVPGGRVAALVDQDASLCDQLRSMGVDAPGFTQLETCLDEIRPEGVFITTPQFVHKPMFEACLQRRIPVFCEKPLAHTLADAQAMVKAAAGHPEVPVAVGYMLGHNPVYELAATLVQQGALGEIKSFQASCRLSQVFSPKKGWTFTRSAAGGGVLINSGCHLLYVLLKVFGRPKGVYVRGGGVHNEVEDSLGIMMDFPNGLWGLIDITWSVPGYENQTHALEVIGKDGTLNADDQWLRLWLPRKSERHPAGWSQWRRAELEPKAAFSLTPEYCGEEFYLEVKDFIDAVRKGLQPKVGLRQALTVQEMIDITYRSMQSGQYVQMPVESAP